MQKETQLLINRIVICILVNVILLIILYSIPVKDNSFLENICLHKLITGKECWNCGMTRAFLSILHLNFSDAFNYNNKCVVVFPVIVGLYIVTWYKFIFKKTKKAKKA